MGGGSSSLKVSSKNDIVLKEPPKPIYVETKLTDLLAIKDKIPEELLYLNVISSNYQLYISVWGTTHVGIIYSKYIKVEYHFRQLGIHLHAKDILDDCIILLDDDIARQLEAL